MTIQSDRPYVQRLANHIWLTDGLRRLINGYDESHEVEVDGKPTCLRYDLTSLTGQLTMFHPEVYHVFNHHRSGEIELRVELKVPRSKIRPENEQNILAAFEANQVEGFVNACRNDNTYAIVQKSWGKELTGPELDTSSAWIEWFEEELKNVGKGAKAFCRPRPQLNK